jgi:hypothetical protein
MHRVVEAGLKVACAEVDHVDPLAVVSNIKLSASEACAALRRCNPP